MQIQTDLIKEYKDLRLKLAGSDLQLNPIKQDANCFFRAIADQLDGDHNLHNKY